MLGTFLFFYFVPLLHKRAYLGPRIEELENTSTSGIESGILPIQNQDRNSVWTSYILDETPTHSCLTRDLECQIHLIVQSTNHSPERSRN